MIASVCLTTLIIAALAPTTSHQQIRDRDGRAWMLIRSKKVLVLHAPKSGQLQVAARSTSARSIRIRAAGDVLTSEPLAPGDDTFLPGQRVGAASLLRVPVPSGGEIYRIEVPKGRAWVAVSLLTNEGAVAFEQPEAATPGLVGLGPITEKPVTVPGLVGLGANPQKPTLKKPDSKMPGLVALGDRNARKKKALSLGSRKPSSLPGLKPIGPAKPEAKGPAVIDRPITELPDVENQDAVTIAKSPDPKPQPKPSAAEAPKGPTLMERLAQLELGLSIAGIAQGRADRFGGQVELEVDVPGTKKWLAAALYLGFSPSNRSGVARVGTGAALPLTISQTTREIPLGLTLRVRPLSRRLANRPVTLITELNAGWHVREGETTVGMINASTQPLTHTSDGSGPTLGLGIGAEVALSTNLLVGAHARFEASPQQEIEINNLIRAQLSQSAAAMALSLRYRFGS